MFRKGSIVYTKDEKGETKVVADGLSDFYDPSSPMTKDEVSGIGSITKQFTSAALLKLWDNELTNPKDPPVKTWFPEGVDSKLAGFMLELKAAYPSCGELFARIENDEHYQDITLRDLLNHTHGLGARNDVKTAELVTKSGANPLAISAIANTTEKREGEVYGKFQYGNFGYDLAGMIIEIVAKDSGVVPPEVPMDGEAFDAALHTLVLDPNGLSNTYTQTDTRASYQENPSMFAMGYFIGLTDEIREIEISGSGVDQCQKAFNLISDTRAAGGIKSTVEDLAKFAPCFMGAKMFNNEEVRSVVFGRAPKTYHLAIGSAGNEMIGHDGKEITYNSDLGFNPKTGETRVELKLTENLIDYVTREIIKQSYPDDYKKMIEIKETYDWKGRTKADPHNPHNDAKYFPFMEKLIADIKETPLLEGEIGILALVEKYIETKKQIAEMPRDKLSNNRDEIIRVAVDKNNHDKKVIQGLESGDSWVKKLGLEDKAEKPRSFLEAAQAGKYGNIGSKGGAHEL